VRADPLASRYAEVMSSSPSERPRRATTLSSGVAAGIQPEIAGYVRPSARPAEK
jgi:hypothetical protein